MTLMKMGIMANINQNIDEDTLLILADELRVSVVIGKVEDDTPEIGIEQFEDSEHDLRERPPIIMRRNKDNRFITAPRLVWGGLLLSLLYAACSQEREESPLQGRSIGFSVTALAVAEGKEADMTESGVKGRTAAASAADTLPAVQVIALKGDDAGEQLYLHALITDGMGQGTPAHYENGPTTKAAPMDNATMYDEMAVTAFIYPATHSLDRKSVV